MSCPYPDQSRGLFGAKVGQNGALALMQEKLVARRAERFVVVVDESKLVERLNRAFLLPEEVLPGAWRQMLGQLGEMGGTAKLRMAVHKAGPVVTDQGNLLLDVAFAGCIGDPQALEMEINNLPWCAGKRPVR